MEVKPTYQELENKIKELESYKESQTKINIAEREKNEKAIRESEEKYRALVENAIMGVVVHDINGNIKYMNNRTLEIMRIKNIQEAYKTPVFKFVHPNYIETIEIGMKNAIYKNTTLHEEQKFIRADGKIIDVIVFAKQIVFDNEKVIQITFNNISDRKQAEQELKKQIEEYASLNEEYKSINDELRNTNKKIEESEEYFKALIENSSDAISIIDEKGTSIYRSASYEKIMGFKVGEMLGKNIFEFIYADDRMTLMQQLASCIKNPKDIKQISFRAYHKNGTLRYLEGTGKNMLNSPYVKGIVINYRDVTIRKQAEKKARELNEELTVQNEEYLTINEELKISEEETRAANEELITTSNALKESNSELLQAKEEAEEIKDHYLQLFDMLPYGGEILDERGLIVNCSQSTARMLGYTMDEVIGKHIINFIDKNTAEIFKKNFVKIKKGQPFYAEAVMIHKNGNKINVLRSAQPVFDVNKKFLNIIVLNVNITERVIAEKKLVLAKEKAEESDRLKTEFINNMSHEIRTPMNGILGFSEFLSIPNLAEAKRNQYVTIIQNSGNQLMRIIDDILEISRLGAKQVQTSENNICLNDLLLEQFSIFDIKAKENKIPLYLKKDLTDEESTILVDEIKLNKILSNLIENALKFTSEGFVEFGYNIIEKQGAIFLKLYVKDTGIGIKQESQKIIFDRFSQEEKELSKNVGGLGLGLSIAKENAELLGGSITLESKKGEGATFFVTIPYNPVCKEGTKIKQSLLLNNELSTINDETFINIVLIVEDEEINHLYIDTLLENFKLKTIHAKNGKEAVEICKENNEINLVLMDLKMPIMNGFEATKLIKELRPNLPIIAQTAYSTNEEKEHAAIVGCVDFISKPISEDALSNVIKKYLDLN